MWRLLLADVMGKFYAVARGHQVGIYKDWKSCEANVRGFANARFKKFATREEAQLFIDIHGASTSRQFSTGSNKDAATFSRKRKSLESDGRGASPNSSVASATEDFVTVNDDGSSTPVVYTDGACSSNGRHGAKAGYGVFWGDDHEDNVSMPLTGPPTNNRAEYTAVICALETAAKRGHKSLVVRTDSKLLISSMTSWINGWRRNGWKKKDGSEVLNVDLIKRLDESMKRVETRFEHVNSHIGIHGNEMADRLAVEGAKRYVPPK